MPQTIESINHARPPRCRSSRVNKVDKDGANPQKVRQELVTHELQPEEWGGTTQFADVSAKTKQGLDDLLEKILLVADAELELQRTRRPTRPGRSSRRLDVGRGPIATMLVQRGRSAWATRSSRRRVGQGQALHDYRGERVKEARPGTPVEILGFDKPPSAASRGGWSRTTARPAISRGSAASGCGRTARAARQGRRLARGPLLADQSRRRAGAEHRRQGRRAGLDRGRHGRAGKIRHPEVGVNVIHTGIGAISESDVILASASNAIVVGFNVRPNAEARALAEREGVDIRTYRVIYQLTEDIQQALVGMLSPEQVEETLGEAEVRASSARRASARSPAATSPRARCARNAQVRVVREGTVIHETTIASLKRFKDDVREVQAGFECGILLENFNDLKEGDVLEFYETREIERTDLSSSRQRRPACRRRRRAGRRLRVAPRCPATSGSSRSSPLPRGQVAQGQAALRPLGEGAAPEPLRRLGRGDRAPTSGNAAPSPSRVHGARPRRARPAPRRRGALAGRAGVRAVGTTREVVAVE